MTIREANNILDRIARVVASVHGALTAEDVKRAEEAKATLAKLAEVPNAS